MAAMCFHRAVWCHETQGTLPAMLAPFRPAPGADPTGVLRVYLGPDGQKPDLKDRKLSLGIAKGSAIWLAPPGPHMLVAEGIEKVIACMSASGLPGIAGGSSTIMVSLKVPSETGTVTLCADRGKAGERDADKLAARLYAEGLAVRVCFPPVQGRDWDECETASVKATIETAAAWEPEHDAMAEAGNEAQPESKITAGRKPLLFVETSNPDRVVAELRDLLAAGGCFFERGVPAVLALDKSLGGLVAHEVTPELVILKAHELCRPWKRINVFGTWQDVDIALPRPLAVMYLRWLGQWRLPVLNGIASGPLLADDGTIRTAAGYDERTGLWCENVPDVSPLVPERPSCDEAAAALLAIRRIFRTFCFADAITIQDNGTACVDLSPPPGLDKSSFLAALLTAVCRPSLWLSPGVLLRAPSVSGSGAGKGLLARLICEIAFGMQPAAITGGAGPEETEKRVAAALISASEVLMIDNVNNQNFQSAQLESAITERPCRVRLLGKLKEAPLNSSAFVILTGNGLGVSGDTARRFPLIVELDAKIEAPESRLLDAAAIRAEVKERRAELLAAALTIWRFGRCTNLRRGLPAGSFERWAAWVRDPLLALGCKDPVQRIAAMKQQDPHRQKLHDLFAVWWERHGSDAMTAFELHDDVKAILVEDPKMRTRQRISAELGKLAGTRLGGFVLTRRPPDNKWEPDRLALER